MKSRLPQPPEAHSIELCLNKGITSRNIWDKKHWKKRMQERRQWESLLWSAAASRKVLKSLKTPDAYKTITIHGYRNHVLDHDNFVGGCKYLLDAMVRLGWMPDDSSASCQVSYEQHVGKRVETRVLIVLPREEQATIQNDGRGGGRALEWVDIKKAKRAMKGKFALNLNIRTMKKQTAGET